MARPRKKPSKKGAKRGQTRARIGECFTIMPFGGWFDEYYETVFRPAIEAAGLKPHRADDLYRPSAIVNDIWSYTKSCKVVLADLTSKNPNVFYELGLAHALGKPAILVAQTIDDVPFDLRSLRVVLYDKNHPRWGETLAQQIRSSIAEVLVAPITAVLPTFLQASDSERVPVSEADRGLLQLRQDLESLTRTVRSVFPHTNAAPVVDTSVPRAPSPDIEPDSVPRAISEFARPLRVDQIMDQIRSKYPTAMAVLRD